jgi:lysophospholipase L1-like esterase
MYNSRAVIYYTAGVVTALTLFTLRRLIYPNESSAAGPKKLKAVFFGDSITQHGFNPEISGWLCHMANWWTRRVDVVNRGFSGYNSRWGVLIVDQVVVPENPDIVFVFFGANDAVDARVGQHVALPEYGDNIRAIIKAIRNVS